MSFENTLMLRERILMVVAATRAPETLKISKVACYPDCLAGFFESENSSPCTKDPFKVI